MVAEPRNMTPLEQVMTMVWLAQNHTLEELRKRQEVIEAQQIFARRYNRPEYCREDLSMMADITSAAVAYQTFLELDVWVSFIKA